MDVTTGVQDVNITVTAPPALTVTVPAVTNVTMPITGVGGLKGDKGDTGAAGTTDYTALTNKPTLGTAAATASTDYATSAQGAKADTAVQPAALTSSLATKANTSHTHSQADVSSLVSDLAAKQATLVSGTNIKTINGTTLLGSGDIAIAGGGGSGTVTSVTSATTDATVATTTTTPVITIVSAPKLTTARTINGTSFDGTANITVADSTKEPTITTGTTAQYYRGDKTFQTLDKTAVGLANVDNTSDATKNSATATLTNKSLQDSTTFIVDDVDNTKKIQFQVSGQGTGTTNVISFPNGASMVVVGTSSTQTLTNKTLTTPIISTISNTGTLTLPTATDTLVGRATTDTLTNKTINAANNTITNVASLSVKQQNDTTNTTVTGARIETGWGVFAQGAVANKSETVTFQTAFTSIPIVTISYGGDQTGGTIALGNGGNIEKGPVAIKAYGESTTGFTAHAHTTDATAWSATANVYYKWTAIGS